MALLIDTIIDRLGGIEAAAKLTSVGTEAVRKWRQAGAVPSKHWPAVMAAGGFSMDDLQAATDAAPLPDAPPPGATAALVLADGTIFWGTGFGAHTAPGQESIAEVCFSTGMTGYQETLTDPSFAGQIITFTFPHIGNVGVNPADLEAQSIAASGLVIKADITQPANWRATETLQTWLTAQKIPGIAGVDTRALTLRIREGGAPSGVILYPADGKLDLPAAISRAAAWPGLEGLDLAVTVTCGQSYEWTETVWAWPDGTAKQTTPTHHVVAVDYGAKRNILRSLASVGCRVTVVPATATAISFLKYSSFGVGPIASIRSKTCSRSDVTWYTSPDTHWAPPRTTPG